MATAFTQVYQYARPDNVDISILGKAQTYKQQLYDTNVAQTQQLINQYAGVDLMRDVDQKYLGERLNTLVNYVNQSGAQDWSRRSIANEVSNYIGQALDENVMAGIASTQRYRKQISEIEDIKKNKPDLYSSQNEWFATRDLQRYLTSNKIGDTYRAGSYIPYTDVNKLITENLPKLKEFMVDVKWTSDGQPLLTRLDKHEVLTQEEASKYVNLLIGDKGSTQLAIDGIYKYKNYGDDELKNLYKTNINNEIKFINDQAGTYNVLQAGKTEAEKKLLRSRSEQLKQQANELEGFSKSIDKLDRDSISSQMHSTSFKKQWSNLLSFDRVTDWKIDDRNFQIAKRNDDLAYKEWQMNFEQDKFMADQLWKEKNYELEKIKALSKGEIATDGDGNPIINTAYSNQGINTTSTPTEPEEGNKTILAEDVYNNYSQAWQEATEATKNYIQELQSTEKGRKILKEHYGNLSEGDSSKLAWAMMRGDKDSQLRLSNLKEIMNSSETGREALSKIQNSISAYRQTKQMDIDLDNAKKGMEKMIKTVMSSDNLNGEFFGLDQQIIDKNGKLAKGTYLGKDYDKLTSQEKLGALIGGISNRLFAGNISDSERSALSVLQKKLISQIKDSEARSVFNDYNLQQNMTYGEYVQQHTPAIGQAFRKGYNWVMKNITGDDEDKAAYDDASKTLTYNSRMSKLYERQMSAHLGDMANVNYTFNDLASGDLKKKNKTLSLGKSSDNKYNLSADEAYNNEVGSHLKKLNEKLQNGNVFNLNNKTINIDTEIKNNKQYLSWAKSYFDSEIQNNANIRVNINEDDNTVTITAPVKNGKEYEMTASAPIPISELPSNLRNKININDDVHYDASNPNALSVYAQGQIYSSKERINELYGDIEINPMSNRSTIDDVEKKVQTVLGKDIFEKHKTEIKEILEKPVDISIKPVNGVYILDTYVGNNLIRKENMGTNIQAAKDLITEQRDKIATADIITFIKNKYSK